jgi:predicted aspartyl protease
MGRIVASITVKNALTGKDAVRCDALVDTGATFLTLPSAWRSRFGRLGSERPIRLETADQHIVSGQVGGPVMIEIEGFPAIYSEVLFLDMKPEEGEFEPLIGYVVLEQCGAAVDMLGHRLVPVKHLDLK